MTEAAIGQLVWFIMGIVAGVSAALTFAHTKGWFDRKTEINLPAPVVNVDWDTICQGVASTMVQANKLASQQRPPINIEVDWPLVVSAVHAEGYMLIARPPSHEPTQKQ